MFCIVSLSYPKPLHLECSLEVSSLKVVIHQQDRHALLKVDQLSCNHDPFPPSNNDRCHDHEVPVSALVKGDFSWRTCAINI